MLGQTDIRKRNKGTKTNVVSAMFPQKKINCGLY